MRSPLLNAEPCQHQPASPGPTLDQKDSANDSDYSHKRNGGVL
jgi:hypothetical protein